MQFSKSKEKWLNQRAKSLGGYISFDLISKNKRAEVYYRTALDQENTKLINSLINSIEKVYAPIKVNNAVKQRKPSVSSVKITINTFKRDKLPIFLRNYRKIVEQFIKLSKRSSKRSIQEALKTAAGHKIAINYDNTTYDELLKLYIDENVSLIQNVSSQTINNIQSVVYNAMTAGQGLKEIKDQLEHQKEVSARRIKLIARDQTAKTNAAINEISQKEAGIKYFEWSTSHDERVSTGFGGHAQLDGKIYAWNDTQNYPVIDTYGNKGIVAQRVNCRCVAKAVIVLSGYVPKQMSDGSYIIIREK